MEPIDHPTIESATGGAVRRTEKDVGAASGAGLLAWIVIGYL